MSVINNKLAMLANKFSKQKFMFYFFIVKTNSVNNFYAVLILYGYVGHHHLSWYSRSHHYTNIKYKSPCICVPLSMGYHIWDVLTPMIFFFKLVAPSTCYHSHCTCWVYMLMTLKQQYSIKHLCTSGHKISIL